MSCSCASRGIFKSRFVIRPLGQPAAVQADARRGAAPLVGHAKLCQRVPDSAGRQRVWCHRSAAVGQADRHAGPECARLGQSRRVVRRRQRGEVAEARTRASRRMPGSGLIGAPPPNPEPIDGIVGIVGPGRPAGDVDAGAAGPVSAAAWPSSSARSSSTTAMASASDRCASASSSSATPGESRCGSSAAARASKRSTMACSRSLRTRRRPLPRRPSSRSAGRRAPRAHRRPRSSTP